MNRPRHSLLSLFDPLTAPETPLRDEESDKENCTPFSALFTRSNDHNPSTPVAPLRKRLVDVGDATLDDTSILDLLTEEQEPLSASVICLETPVPPFQRRTPLARLPLGDANSTPVVRFKPHSSPLLLSQVTPNANEINTPEILVSSSDSPFQGNTESSTRLCAPSIASHRLSIDLQAAFQMHFQSNSSFDLLNDKISLIEPMESLLADDENFDFELERENLWDAMAKFKKESSGRLRSQDDPTESPKPEAKSDPAPDTNSQREPWDDTLQSPTSPRGNSQPSQDLPTPAKDRASLPNCPLRLHAAVQ
ncbi:hypothetical protein F5887DRAFT_942096 [Amanita rubescens]|nr:hypothetical protein F5887DRAFT_942096 [Amanita rubescens]